MKKRAFSSLVIFVFLIVGTLTGNGQKEIEAPVEEKSIVVGFSQGGNESGWRKAHSASFTSTFTAENGYSLIFDDANQQQENQIKALRNFIRQDVDYIILSPAVQSGWGSILGEAKNAGIPVILTDGLIDLTDETLFTAWVGADYVKEGQDSVRWLNDYLRKTGRDKDEIRIVHLQGILGSTAQTGRTTGIQEELSQKPNYTLLASQTGESSQAKAQVVMESLLKMYTEIDVVFSENDEMSYGVIDAIKAAGKEPGREIIIISFDAYKKAFFKILNGEMNCSVESNPLHGPRISQIIQTLEVGGSVNKIVYINEETFDMFNAEVKLPTRQY